MLKCLEILTNKKVKQKHLSCRIRLSSPSAGRNRRNKKTNPGIRLLSSFAILTTWCITTYRDISTFDTATVYICIRIFSYLLLL